MPFEAPVAAQTGIIPECKTFHRVMSGYICQKLADQYKIKLADLYIS